MNRVSMNLKDLLSGLAVKAMTDIPVQAFTADSRQVHPGDVFVALRGSVADGHLFLRQATLAGAAAVVVQAGLWSPEALAGWHGVVVEVADSRFAYAVMAENYYGRPADGLRLLAVTGTNGKTTVSYLVEQCLLAAGETVGVIGTVNYRYTSLGTTVTLPSPNTTPDALVLQALLREMADAGVKTVIMEVSSHALVQQRLGNLRFDCAAFTNLSQDHLDYHADMADYFAAKQLLFSRHLQKNAIAVINGDAGPWAEKLLAFCLNLGVRFILCGHKRNADIRLLAAASNAQGSRHELAGRWGKFVLTSPLAGGFNAENLLVAAALLLAIGMDIQQLRNGLVKAKGAPGRLQRVEAASLAVSRPTVFVDYAHTPDAVRKALATLKELPHKWLFCVIGCGGDRDKKKRPLMGEVAAELADILLIADDNPRGETPEQIRHEIEAGVLATGMTQRDAAWLLGDLAGESGFVNIGDRALAIKLAVRAAEPGDIVALLGKGHERYQQGKDGKHFFDDSLEALTALTAWRLPDLVAATGGCLRAGEKEMPLAEVSTDTRSIGGVDIFVALKGDNFDGHDFQEKAEAAGAGCLVVDRGKKSPGLLIPVLEVDDTLLALHQLAAFRRRLMAEVIQPKIVAITGSCGKTTTKEMLAAILRAHYPGPDNPSDCVLSTTGNLNNLIGLPLTLLAIGPRHRAAVVEMGMNAPGEIARMAATADADICCITNVHGVHLEGLGDINGVARAKEELFAEAGDEAVLIVNGDDPHIVAMASRYPQRRLIFSARGQAACPRADIWAEHIGEGENDLAFTLCHAEQRQKIVLPLIGRHHVECAIAACACAVAVGVPLA
ncbi:MAG TPA: UDP-N-acetylmuramoyl-L-alanyl-D-glutamate--2,6-diaminopimelate ligase, partial [Desulfobulbaceae bacterium]|nr:UDP-N-acetylmuramoyl-L-alanyl-D-glutamate--2,6-diaminopimelate ligase [Desulfobulbaceae bacterium]